MISCLALCAACSSIPGGGPQAGILFDEVVLRNDTGDQIENVRIEVAQFDRFFSCSYIMPRSTCSTGFKPRRYRQNGIEISWTQRGQDYVSGPIVVPADGSLDRSRVYKAVVVILGERQFTARFETDR